MPSGLSISDTRDYFLRDGEGFFYLADTCWSAFTNVSLEEWSYYLDYRASQGFNALQINILPQHDRSESPYYIDPFAVKSDGDWDFNKINEEYFDRAERMIEMAVDKGFVPALVVLWCNYVPGTWGSRLIKPRRVVPRERLESYVEYVVERFGKYNPIFIISGDTNFESPEAEEYYLMALEVVKRECPKCLTTMHLAGGLWQLPKKIVESPYYDFYMFQSGHDGKARPYELAQRFYKMPIKRPIVNGEPCYEGLAGGRYYRHYRFDVRKAVWQSLLSGAKAGVAYGALGIWNWHRRGAKFFGEGFAGPSFDWRTALKFPGADDVALTKCLFKEYDLFDIQPSNDLLLDASPEIRVATGKGKVVVYAPYAWNIKLKVDASSYRWFGLELDGRRIFKPDIKQNGDIAILRVTEFNSDYVIVGMEA